jgi:hypothetical protein
VHTGLLVDVWGFPLFIEKASGAVKLYILCANSFYVSTIPYSRVSCCRMFAMLNGLQSPKNQLIHLVKEMTHSIFVLECDLDITGSKEFKIKVPPLPARTHTCIPSHIHYLHICTHTYMYKHASIYSYIVYKHVFQFLFLPGHSSNKFQLKFLPHITCIPAPNLPLK